MGKSKGLFQLIRFELPFSAGVCVVMGQLLADGNFPAVRIIAAGFLSVFCLSAAVLVLNDLIDVETDRVNAPNRPIAANLISPGEALAFALVLYVLGLAFAAYISGMSLFCALLLMAIGLLYNLKFKKFGIWGNLLVSFSVAMTFIYGGITVRQPSHIAVLLFAAIGGLINLGEEISADVNDAEGDRIIGSRSIALLYGDITALRLSAVAFFLAIALTAIPFILGWFALSFLIVFIPMDLCIGYAAIQLQQTDPQSRRNYIRVIYLSGAIGIVLFLMLRMLRSFPT